MTAVRVADVTMKFDAGTAGYLLAVVMVPGTFPGGREIDAGHLHPEVREHLASWAGGPSLLPDLIEDLRVLQVNTALGATDPAEIAAGLASLVERYTR